MKIMIKIKMTIMIKKEEITGFQSYRGLRPAAKKATH